MILGVDGLEANLVSRVVAPIDCLPLGLCSVANERWMATDGRLVDGARARCEAADLNDGDACVLPIMKG